MIFIIVCNSQVVPSVIIVLASVHMFLITFCARSEETWILYFTCKGALAREETIQYEIDRSDLTFGNLLTMKSHMGYGVRDYLYYKRRCGNTVATLKEIDYDVDANSMVESNAEEREVRLVLSRDQLTERNVDITPIKLPRNTSISEDFADESIDEYKDWLSDLHEQGQGMGKLCCCPSLNDFCNGHITNISMIFADLKDKYREDTIETYKEWLRVQGQLDDISNKISFSKMSTKLSFVRKPFITCTCHHIICRCICQP
jgi:hypothetical protein